MDLPKETEQFSDAYRRLSQALLRVGEPRAAYAPPSARLPERLVKCLWFDQYVVPEKLATASGCRIEVLSPGWWNVEAGPDFLNSELRVEGGEILRGHVEVHVDASDWKSERGLAGAF